MILSQFTADGAKEYLTSTDVLQHLVQQHRDSDAGQAGMLDERSSFWLLSQAELWAQRFKQSMIERPMEQGLKQFRLIVEDGRMAEASGGAARFLLDNFGIASPTDCTPPEIFAAIAVWIHGADRGEALLFYCAQKTAYAEMQDGAVSQHITHVYDWKDRDQPHSITIEFTDLRQDRHAPPYFSIVILPESVTQFCQQVMPRKRLSLSRCEKMLTPEDWLALRKFAGIEPLKRGNVVWISDYRK